MPVMAVSGDASPPPVTGLDPRVRGTLVHALLEDLDFRRPIAPGRAKVRALDASLSDEEVEDVRALVAAFARSPLCARLAGAGRGVRREAPFAFALEPAADAPLLTGFVDVMATEPDGGVLVVDYKTDQLAPGDTPAAAVARAYTTQRLVYALAALRGGARRVEVAHSYLERPEEVASETFTAADAVRVADALRTLAGGVLRDEYPVTGAPHRELCGSCPGRPALCSHPQERTLRPVGEPPATPPPPAPGR
jgi:ATP-dependent helicase/nuclease subunit A